MKHRRNPYRAPKLPPPPPELDHPYPHTSGGFWGSHPPHDGSCVDYDGWQSPWELHEVHYDTTGLLQ